MGSSVPHGQKVQAHRGGCHYPLGARGAGIGWPQEGAGSTCLLYQHPGQSTDLAALC